MFLPALICRLGMLLILLFSNLPCLADRAASILSDDRLSTISVVLVGKDRYFGIVNHRTIYRKIMYTNT